MVRRWRPSGACLAVVALGLAAWLMPGSARAQYGAFGGGGAPGGNAAETGTGSQPPMFSNFLMNPYMNPLINPYANQQATAVSPGTAALYMFAAQSMYTGIGSGRISGSRPGPGSGQAGTAGAAKKARTTANTPGGNASRYFNREYVAPASKMHANATSQGHYYNRQSRYYPQVGN